MNEGSGEGRSRGREPSAPRAASFTMAPSRPQIVQAICGVLLLLLAGVGSLAEFLEVLSSEESHWIRVASGVTLVAFLLSCLPVWFAGRSGGKNAEG